MGRLVMKFGGTSVANIDRIRNVAHHVKREVDAGHDVAVVVSAMAGKTNELVDWCREASPMHDAREYDAVVASGEQVTAGLLAIALQTIGIQARSWQGWQIPIKTSDAHASARILDIDGSELINRLVADGRDVRVATRRRENAKRLTIYPVDVLEVNLFDPAQLDAWVDQYFGPIPRPATPVPQVTAVEPPRMLPAYCPGLVPVPIESAAQFVFGEEAACAATVATETLPFTDPCVNCRQLASGTTATMMAPG